MRKPSRKIAFLGLCTAVAMILSYVEILLPPIFTAIPGIKIGLPNIVTLFILYRYSFREAVLVSFVRVFAVGLLFGNPMTLAYSAAGALLSITVMALLKKLNKLSVLGVSVAGAVFHNVGQIIMAIILLGVAEIGYYLIVLTVTGTVSGILVGICGGIAERRLPKFRT